MFARAVYTPAVCSSTSGINSGSCMSVNEPFPENYMQFRSVLMCAALLIGAGCGKNIKPMGPVLTGWERAQDFSQTRPSGASYRGSQETDVPVLPLLPFGVAFDLDLVVKSKHPDWDMHEYARVQTPDGTMWLVLESRNSGEQVIIADLPEIDAMMPELPIQRISGPVRVEDSSNADGVNVRVTYTNADGDPVEAEFQSKGPHKLQTERNGNPMGHSEGDVLVGLDIPARESAFYARVDIADERYRSTKIGGILPFQFVMQQTQAGLASASFYQEALGPMTLAATESSVTVVSNEQLLAEAEAAQEPEMTATEKFFYENREVTDACVQAEEGAEAPSGTVTVSWTMDVGDVSELSIGEDSTLADETIQNCLMEAVKNMEQPEWMEGDNVFTFAFEAPEGEEVEEGTAVAGSRPEESETSVSGERPEELEDGEESLEDFDLDDEDEDMVAEEETVEEAASTAMGLAVNAFRTIHTMESGQLVSQQWDIDRQGDRVFVTQTSNLRTIQYEFMVFGSLLELASVQTTQWGRSAPTMKMSFNPALPDLRQNFGGKVKSQFVMDVNGQENYMVGDVETFWKADLVKVAVTPAEPSWAAARPMVTTLNFRDGRTNVVIERRSAGN